MTFAAESAETTPPPSRWQRFVQFFLIRIIIAVLFLIVAVAIVQGIRWLLVQVGIGDNPVVATLRRGLSILFLFYAYHLYVRWIEKRAVTELSMPGWAKELGAGMGLGFGLIAVQIIFLTVTGFYRVSGFGSWAGTGEILMMSLIAATLEELIMRGILFRILEEGLGSWVAIVLSSLVFGFMHAFNPGASIYTSIAITVEAGLMLALLYMLTRRLWLVMGLHFAWNFALGGVFGLTVSGVETQGLLAATLSGPELITGGEFGLEMGITAMVATLIVSGYLLRKLWQENAFIAPPWQRESRPEISTEIET